VIPNYLAAMPQFLTYVLMGGLLLWLFASLYTFLTPQDEMALIREGNMAACLLLIGALLGFLLPLAKAIAQHSTLMATIQWALLSALVQLGVYAALRLFWQGLHAAVLAERSAVGLFAGFISVSAGILNAAAMP